MASTNVVTHDELLAEQQRIAAAINAIAAELPDSARDFVRNVGLIEAELLETTRARLQPLIEARDRIDDEFKVRQRESVERAAFERERRIHQQVAAIDDAHARTLDAVERMEAAISEFNAAFHEAVAANKEANAASKDISGGTWSGFPDMEFRNDISRLLAGVMIAAHKGPRLGQHCSFIPPPGSVRVVEKQPELTWRERVARTASGSMQRIHEVFGGLS